MSKSRRMMKNRSLQQDQDIEEMQENTTNKGFAKNDSLEQFNENTEDRLNFEIEQIEKLIEDQSPERITTGMRQLSNIKDTEAFEYFAVSSSKAEARLFALNEIGMNPDALLEVSEETDDEEVRKIAVEKLANIADELEDEEFFLAIAKNHNDGQIREIAIANIESENKLKEVARESTYIATRMSAIRKIQQNSGTIDLKEVYDSRSVINYLGEIANSQKEAGIETMVSDFLELEEQTKNAQGEVKDIAEHIKGDYAKGIVALLSSTNDMQKADKLIGAIQNETKALSAALKYSKSKKVKTKVAKILSKRIEEINDERIIVAITKETTEIPVEKLAVDKVDNPEMLAKIAKFAKNKKIKKMAKNKLGIASKLKQRSRAVFDEEDQETEEQSQNHSGRGFIGKIVGLFHELIGF